MKEINVDNLLNIIGFGFPEDADQLNDFNKVYKNFPFESNVNSINPEKILEAIRRVDIKITRIDYHKRTVLAAEIVYRLQNEWSMGHLKLQKLLYLCQNVLNMKIHANFLKQAMGPYDPILMRSLDKQFKQHKWFKFNNGKKFPKYELLEKAGGHREWYEKYYQNNLLEIESIIETFRKIKTREIELITTIYACWIKVLEKKQTFNENLIISKVYEWSPHKEKFSETEILNSISWMLEKGVYPNI